MLRFCQLIFNLMNSAKTEILILGIGQSNFLNQLYSGVNDATDDFSFAIDGYFDLSKGKNDEKILPYSKNFNFKAIDISRWKRYQAFLNFAKTPFFYKVLLFELSQKSKRKKIKNLLFELSIAKYIVEDIIVPLEFNIFHFHFCNPKNVMMTYFLPKEAKIICSFWGSDLMRDTGVSNVFYVSKALKIASRITIQTPEMAEMLYCKYGREFTNKTTSLRFTINEEIFNQIDYSKQISDRILSFKKKYNISSYKTIIALGHNAFRENNHLKMIDVLSSLKPEILDSCEFVLHLSYGGNQRYIEKLIDTVDSQNKLTIHIIKDFFPPEEIALLRLTTDILIQMPISDALSGAMTEVLYAGNTVIAGSWLPYGFFRRSGIHFNEIDTFAELPALITFLLEQKQSSKNKNNRTAIRKYFLSNTTTPAWIDLFEDVKLNA